MAGNVSMGSPSISLFELTYPTMTEAIPPKPPARKDLTEEAVEEAAVEGAAGLTSCLGVTGMDTCSDDIVGKEWKRKVHTERDEIKIRIKGGRLPI